MLNHYKIFYRIHNNDLSVINDTASFEYDTIIKQENCNANATTTIPDDCTFIEVRFWFDGAAVPPYPRANFIKNLPCKCTQSLYFYDGTYRCIATIVINWRLKSCELSNVALHNNYWHIGITFFK